MKKRLIFIGWLVVMSICVGAISCRNTGPAVAGPAETSGERPEAVTPPPEPTEEPSGDWNKILQTREKEKALTDAEKKTLAENLYETGFRLYLESKYDEALENFNKALELVPDHQKAKQYKNEILSLKGEVVPGDVSWEVKTRINEIKAIMEQLTLELQNHLNKGIRYYDTGDYEHAEEEFKWVIQTAQWHPYPIDLAPYKKQAEGYLEKTENKKKERDVEVKRVQELEARRLAEQEEAKRREEYIANLESLLRAANNAFQKQQFNECMRLCNKVLEINPSNQFAIRLKDIAFYAQRNKRKQENMATLGEEWKKTFEEFQLKVTGITETITFPDKDSWTVISQRGPRQLTKEKPVSAKRRATELLLERRLTFPFADETALQDVITYIRTQVEGINILVSDPEVDINVRIRYNPQTPTPIRQALNAILKIDDAHNYRYMIEDEEGMVLITTAKKVFQSELETRNYDILDLIIEMPKFNAPAIGLIPPKNPAQAETPEAKISSDELVTLIKENLGRDDGGFTAEGARAEFQSPNLIITHVPRVHAQVEQLLKGLRSSMDMVVTVEARFLTVEENFLEDIGVDTAGLGAPVPALPAVFSSPAPAGPGFTALTPGIYRAVGGRDLRARVEQTIASDTLIGGFAPQAFSPARTSTASYTRTLGQTQLQFLLRAISKEERGKILAAPKITVYNGQRGYIYITDQFAYVRDYTMVSAGPGQLVAQPNIASLLSGRVLEVRPSISADLKYISMELWPQMVTPIQPLPAMRRLVVTVDQIGAVVPSRIAYELPDVSYQQAQTNVVIPDGGTILIGGYHTGQEIDTYSGVPVLSKIPIIGALFSEKAQGAYRDITLMLVKGQITVMSQEEKERF